MLNPGDSATAVYVRVSSTDQSFRSQLGDLESRTKSIDGPVEWYRDKASGLSMARPEWQRLWADCQAGRITTLIVWRLDRLGRTASGLTQLFDDLLRLKVELVSLKDGFQLTTPSGRLLANIMASVAAYETEVRSERQRAGIVAAQSEGVKFGRPKGSGRPLKVTPEHCTLIPHLKAGGSTIAGIARATGLSRDTIYAVLRSTKSTDGITDGSHRERERTTDVR